MYSIMTFSDSVFSLVLLIDSQDVCSSRSLFQVLWIIYPFRIFVIFFPCTVFHIMLLLYPVVDLTLCLLHRLVLRIVFNYFGRSCFVCIDWPFPGTFWASFLWQYLLIHFFQIFFSDLSAVVFLKSIYSVVLCLIPLPLQFRLLLHLLYSSSSPYLPLWFWILVRIPFGDNDFITD